MNQSLKKHRPPMTEPRDMHDRLGEALRRWFHGLIRPLWRDMSPEQKQLWRDRAAAFEHLAHDVGIELRCRGRETADGN
jgi:hypothetical protein